MRFVAICIAAVLAWASPQTQELQPWVLQLSRIKRHLRTNFERLPNYVCQQTIDRFYSSRRGLGFRHLDTLRLEVAFVGGRELFAREGEREINESNPAAFLSRGAFGTGAFSGTASNLFVFDQARITGFAPEQDNGRPLWRYDFEIPQLLAPSKVTVGTVVAVVGERGSFLVDAQTLDLLEIEDEATDIPATLGVREITTVIRYRRMKIGSSEAILPKTAEMLMVGFDGNQNRNVTTFSGCREYSAETRITFGQDVVIPPVKPLNKK